MLEITIRRHDDGSFDVVADGRLADHLTWDEMLGQVASLTHPQIKTIPYRMLTPDELAREAERMSAAFTDILGSKP